MNTSVYLVLLTAPTCNPSNALQWKQENSAQFPSLDALLLALADSALICATTKSQEDKERDKRNVDAFRTAPDHLTHFEVLPSIFSRRRSVYGKSQEIPATEILDSLLLLKQEADYLTSCLSQTSLNVIRRAMFLATPMQTTLQEATKRKSVASLALTDLQSVQSILSEALIASTDVDVRTGRPRNYLSMQVVSASTFDIVKGGDSFSTSFFSRL